MDIKQEKKGISLIVLVITIIVMIILATAIILSLNGSGVIGRANEAVEKSDIANAKNVVSLAYAEWELDEGELKDTYSSFAEYANAKLREAGFGEEYVVNEDSELLTGIAAVLVNNNVPIGTTVTGYALTEKSYTTDGTEYDYYNDESQTLKTNTSLEWKYVGIDDDGKVLILADMPSVVPDDSKIVLGYETTSNINLLNTICDSLYTTTKGEARHIDLEDVESILGYTGPKVNYYCNTNMLVSSNKNLSYQGVADLLGYGTIVGHIQQYSTVWEGDVIDYRIINNNSEYINSNIDLIFSNNQYWLSTSYRALHSLYSTEDMENMGYYYEEEGIYYDDQWGLYFVDNTKVSGTFFANSDISPTDGGPYAIRPIVELNSNVKFTYENGVINLQ